MILGIGLDLTQIERIENFTQRFGPRFAAKICTDDELRELAKRTHPQSYARNLAGRIAAKEAASKALGTGFRGGIGWKCFAVSHEPSGRPTLRVFGEAAQKLAQIGVKNISLSITHDAGVAAAVVIFEG